MSATIKLRYLPTNEELRDSTLSKPELARVRAWRKRAAEPVYGEAARILLRWGLDPATAHILYCRIAYEEARRRLGPDPLVS